MSLNPRQSDKKVSKPVLPNQIQSHNFYPDLKNKWAPSALEYNYSICDIFCFFVVVFLLGWLSSQLIIFTLRAPLQSPKEIEILDAEFKSIIEKTSEYIDYASSQNGGQIDYGLSTPEFHGFGADFTKNSLKALISNDNSAESCWPILGNYGYATIKLGQEIYPIGFSIVLPQKFIKSIPKRVTVYSLDSEGCYILAIKEISINPKGPELPSSVFFECEYRKENPASLIMIEINENYGSDSTCMYQFKVHGKTSK